MTGLVPLLESSSDDLERALLLSHKRVMPGRAGLQDTALALGLAAPVAKALADALVAESLRHAAGLHSIAAISASGANAISASASGVSAASGALTSGSGALTSGSGALTSGSGALVASASAGVAGAQAPILVIIAKYLVSGAMVSLLAMTTLDHALGPGSSSAPLAQTREPAVSVGSQQKPARAAQGSAPLDGFAASSTALERADAAPSPATAPDSLKNANKLLPKRRDANSQLPQLPAPAGQASQTAPPDAPSAPALAAPVPAVPSASAPSNTSLAGEIRVLDRARAALAEGNAEGARRLLDQYAANRPSGVLAQEADLLRVQLLLKLGDRPAAAQLAQQIIRQNPESSHVDSLRNLLSE